MGLFKQSKKEEISEVQTVSDNQRNKILLIFLLIVLGVFSFTIGAEIHSDPNTYAKTVEIIDGKKDALTILSASTTTASLVLGAVPGDTLTPIANQFAGYSSDLLIILGILYFEKYALTVIGLIVFKYIFPVLCLVSIFSLGKDWIIAKTIVKKVFAFSIVLLLVIPASAKLTRMMDDQLNANINETANEIDQYSNENVSILQKITTFADETVNKAKNWLSSTTESIAMFFVTSCMVPIFTLFIFMQLTNIIFGTNMNMAFIKQGKEVINASIKKANGINKQLISKAEEEEE